MLRQPTALACAVLCHPTTSWADQTLPEPIPLQTLQIAIDVVKAANDLGALRTCSTERCLRQHSLKNAGKTAILVLGLVALKRIFTPANARAYFTSFATKKLARFGLTAAGITGAYAVVVVYAAYSATVDAITPTDSMAMVDSILTNDDNRVRFLAMPKEAILSHALHDPWIAEELVLLAYGILTAQDQAPQVNP